MIPRLLRVVGPRGNWRSSSDNIMLILGGEFGGMSTSRYPNKNPLESFAIMLSVLLSGGVYIRVSARC